MKPSVQDIKLAVSKFGALKFFPSDEGARLAVMELIRKMVSTKAELLWLTEAMIDEVGEWHGTAQLRALFCSRFKPADGREGADCIVPGFTAVDGERKFIEKFPAPNLLSSIPENRQIIEGVAKSFGGVCPHCKGLGHVALPGAPDKRIRCTCRYGQELPEDVMDALNKPAKQKLLPKALVVLKNPITPANLESRLAEEKRR